MAWYPSSYHRICRYQQKIRKETHHCGSQRFRSRRWLRNCAKLVSSPEAAKKIPLAASYFFGSFLPILTFHSDMVVAAPRATFGLPEALRGIYAGAGGLPRLIRNVGLPIASEIAMTGRTLTAQEALQYQLINKISKTDESVVEEAVALAKKCADISPDAIIVTRLALREAWETGSVERAFQLADERLKEKLTTGENAREGLKAFAEKRKPNWVPSKL